MPIVIAIILGLSALVVVCYPLLGLAPVVDSSKGADPLAEVVDRETQAKRALREVDFDRRLGNLEDTDYAALRDRYEQAALEALRERYERERELDAIIDRELATLRSNQPAAAATVRSQTEDGGARPRVVRSRSRTAAQTRRPRRREGV